MGEANTIPVEIQLVAIGNAETVNRINQVSNAAKRAGGEGFGALEHFLIRVSGGNRELMMGLRGLSQLMQGASGDTAKFGDALKATLAGVGVGLAAVAVYKAFEGIADSGRQAFEDIGESSHGFFGDLLAGIGVIDTLNGKLEKTADVTSRLNDNFQRTQKLKMEYAAQDAKGVTQSTVEQRKLTKQEDTRQHTVANFQERGKELEDLKKSIGATTNLGDLYTKIGVAPPKDVEKYGQILKNPAMMVPNFFIEREKEKENIRNIIDQQIEANTRMQADYSQQAGTTEQKQNQKVIDTQANEYWRTLEERQMAAKFSGRPDMMASFLTQNSPATIGSTLEKMGVADPYSKSPEAAEKLLAPLFRGIESQAERLREDAIHPHIAPLAVAGTAESWRQTAEYKNQAQTGGNTVAERALTQAQIQTALLQQLNQTLGTLTVHGGN